MLARCALLALATAVPLFLAPVAAADDGYVSFLSPSGNISCELNYQRGPVPDGTFCLTNSPAQSVQLEPSGSISVCNGVSCLGNAGEGTPTLAYGQTVHNGPFACESEVDGVACTVPSGHGFHISDAGVTPLG